MKTIKRVFRWLVDTLKQIERMQLEMIEYQTIIKHKYNKRDSRGRFCR